LRLWVASTDYFEDVRIGKEVLAGTSDAYRKLRNTFRYLLGALDGFTDAEKIAPADMPELERWVLHRLAALDAELKAANEGYEFNRYVRALMAFANEDLSAFFFDIRKDSLYCDAPSDAKRRAYRTVLDIVFHALTRWLAPVLCFTCEEAWGTRYPEGGSVHLLEWPEIDAAWRDAALASRWDRLRTLRSLVTEAVEPMRREKKIGSSLEAEIMLGPLGDEDRALVASVPFEEICITASVSVAPKDGQTESVTVTPTDRRKCGRCWRHLPEVKEDGDLCDRCDEVVNG
jgi:isoleucyl-tRNA synthetase